MYVSEVLLRRHDLDGATVTINAVMIVMASGAYLVDSANVSTDQFNPDKLPGQIIEVLHSSLVDDMINIVPAFVGGPYCYWDNVVIRGSVAIIEPGQTVLRSPGMLIVQRPDETYHVYPSQ